MKIIKFFFLFTFLFFLNSFYACNSCNKNKGEETNVEESIDSAVDYIQEGMNSMEEGAEGMVEKAGEAIKSGLNKLKKYKENVNAKWDKLKLELKNEKARKLAENYVGLVVDLAEKKEVDLPSAAGDLKKEAEVKVKIDELNKKIISLDKQLQTLYTELEKGGKKDEVTKLKNFISEIKN